MAKQKKPDAPATDTVQIPYLKIVLCLFLISTVCAALLGATYLLTEAPIRANEEAAIRSTLTSIYGDDAVFESDVAVPQGQAAEAVYLAKNADGTPLGYAVRVLSAGFSDDIDMIVGFDSEGAILKIEIIALSETAGLGSLVAEEEYLAQYVGREGELVLKEDIDAVSGATKSSRAVLAGANLATECLRALGV